MDMGLPAGRKTPRGKTRWYLVLAPRGREVPTCERLKSVLPNNLVTDAFVMRKERWSKRRGVWSLGLVQMYPGYLFVATPDVIALDKALKKSGIPCSLANSFGRGFMPLAKEAQAWFNAAMDEAHVLRGSKANIIEGELQVYEGPLKGQESRVRKIDRRKRTCLVGVVDADGGFTESMALDIPFKS